MVAIYGPSSRKKAPTPQSGGIVLLKPNPLLVDADTLESALEAYSSNTVFESGPMTDRVLEFPSSLENRRSSFSMRSQMATPGW